VATKKKETKREGHRCREIQMKRQKGIGMGKSDTSFTRGGKEEGETEKERQ